VKKPGKVKGVTVIKASMSRVLRKGRGKELYFDTRECYSRNEDCHVRTGSG